MTTPSRLILIFAVAFAILIVAPAFLDESFGAYPLMSTGDALDILTPVVLIPLYWLLFRLGKTPTTAEIIAFLVLIALWVEGQGMHLGANSIKHLMGEMRDTDAYTLAYFYDEILGHYLWHIGLAGLTLLLIWRQMHNSLETPLVTLRLEAVAALIYGIVYPVIVIEAGTTPLGIPVAIIICIVGLVRLRELRRQPMTAFFFVAHALAIILFAIWFIRWGGFPQFSEVGLI